MRRRYRLAGGAEYKSRPCPDYGAARNHAHTGHQVSWGDYYILQAKIPVPCDLMTWACWLKEHLAERIVKQESVGQFWVSSVFIGLDHSLRAGPPLLFETMVFDKSDQEHPLNAWMERAPTWELALETHERGVAWAHEQLQ